MSEAYDYSEFFDDEPQRAHKDRPKYRVLYEDERIVVFDKAPGVAAIRERFQVGVSLKEIAEERLGRLWTVHRIDKDTSGVILFARDADAHKLLNDQFERHEPLKIYAAVLEGEMVEEEMTIDIPIAVDPANAARMRPSARGKESLTVLRVRERFRGFTYVEARPRTGRQHQIRVHCKAVGLPLAVDPLYGNRSELFLSAIKRRYRGYDREEKPLMARLTLHAEQLTIQHPGTGQPATFTAPLPRDMNALLTQLRKARG
ncbi:MAG TPA: RluA family pseudouridine synthase [Candidatus Kapabacteria bacterium]|nr:RluA family pseudouridine synthase [Candidatus Kapabacteria bacterium]